METSPVPNGDLWPLRVARRKVHDSVGLTCHYEVAMQVGELDCSLMFIVSYVYTRFVVNYVFTFQFDMQWHSNPIWA